MNFWEIFEIEGTDFLNKMFSGKAKFTRCGGTNSKNSDIMVEKQNGEIFYIEVKYCPAQSGQFVLLPNLDSKKFEYSPLNDSKINKYAQEIINHMNSKFQYYVKAGTSGKELIFSNSQSIFSDWIKSHYKRKKVRFILVNNFKLVDIENINEAFNISAKYRVKKSGTSNVSIKKQPEIIKYIQENYSIIKIVSSNKKLLVWSNFNLHNIRFNINNYEYLFSKRDNCFEIRKLSNTFNASVIFSINIKKDAKYMPITDFLFRF
ncbi:hypothetical protein NPA07_04825 [Mycoplasmopsis caviae]|uniref:Uncharacterized protein n=1 Tax=Mycoplasmopsis caviae TaxID=55603 RepID=A0A3P8L7C1_9BACT|nr:hypothetical protein [Mycoplasmopsis caviae]UUD35099.1 hypothetical protein NPA07_04825 [Mycoplasmopsis caviae]VDR42085.1 Uncharacterised protein [Mycoplasmopsis caviae]